MTYSKALERALWEAEAGVAEGGMPFGAALVVNGDVVASGRNRQIQDGRYFSHAEINCLGEAVRRPFGRNDDVVMVATEAPCPMCAGAIVVSGIRHVVVGEDVHYPGALDWLKERDVKVRVAGHQGCIDLVGQFKKAHSERWEAFSAG